MLKLRILLIGIVLLNVSCKSNQMLDTTTVKDFKLEQYLGKWYEIDRFDHKFQRNMINVTANYKKINDKKIEVRNRGYNTKDEEYSEAIGKAKQPDPIDNPGRLKVAFFLWFYADYNVLEIDKNYQYALIGSSNDKYLWILSRTPKLDQKTIDMLYQKAEARGYDTDKFLKIYKLNNN